MRSKKVQKVKFVIQTRIRRLFCVKIADFIMDMACSMWHYHKNSIDLYDEMSFDLYFVVTVRHIKVFF